MKKSESERLKELIWTTEVEVEANRQCLREHFTLTCESLKPLNIVRHAIGKMLLIPVLATALVKASDGLTENIDSGKEPVEKPKSTLAIIIETIFKVAFTGKAKLNAGEINSMEDPAKS